MRFAYEVIEDPDVPVPKRPKTWDMPLGTLKIGHKILLKMGPREMTEKIRAVRAYVHRQQQRLGRKFSVYQTDDGILIFRREDKDNKE